MLNLLKKKKKLEPKPEERWSCKRSLHDNSDELYMDWDGKIYKKVYIGDNLKNDDNAIYCNWNSINGKVREVLFLRYDLQNIGYCTESGSIFINKKYIDNIELNKGDK